MNTETITTRPAPAPPATTTNTSAAARVTDDGFAVMLSHAGGLAPEPASEQGPPAAPAAVAVPAVAVPATPALLPTPAPALGAGVVSPGTIGALLAAAAASGSAAVAGTLAQLIGPVPSMTVAPTAGPSTDIDLSGDMEQRRASLQPLFEAAGARYGVDPDLLAAVAWTESAFQPDVVSHAGAIGLMQIMPGTAGDLGVDPRDPAQAIDGAARYLRDAFEQFGDVRLALAAYNAGPGAVASHGGIPPYPETTAYVVKVMDRYESLRGTST
ncbi:MAG: lytic transglycosylase domain-containing protein [Acidimicrobiales bacterium]